MDYTEFKNEQSGNIPEKAKTLINKGNWPSEIKMKQYVNETVVTSRLIGHFKDHRENTSPSHIVT